ncbi:MAG: heme A synthase [Prochlorococcus sp. SP3034]|nr:heme A synthase [Prochlorococcus sp. SP3034]|tara:strand:- start:2632 stop:3585 length:954 start_codon:yes stop_codon:yes gene_type:complete
MQKNINFNFLNNLEINTIKYKSILIKIGNHSVLAIITLIGIGSATRVMEAGLACPDWPLCYGSLFPTTHFNIRVFLEWFHRLDAFLVGLLILTQFLLSLIWRKYLPSNLSKKYSVLLFLVILQGSLGALTVINMLDSFTVMGHLFIAFILLIASILINQNLINNNINTSFNWWKILLTIPLALTLIQSIIGVRLSSTWSAHLCLSFNKQCMILDSHKLFAIPLTFSILTIILISFFKDNLFKNNWKYFTSIFVLLIVQIILGVLSLKTNLNEPLIIISHEIIASLLVATFTTLICGVSSYPKLGNQTSKESLLIGAN